ncbi:hypothetical protein B0H21DRAFT_710233 [Amylocystis lapponica]|nr:hypothetical protein B0H21DRAFT_710233 [Amylocystis lapponica]
MPHPSDIEDILNTFDDYGTTITAVVVDLLCDPTHGNHPIVHDLVSNVSILLDALACTRAQEGLAVWASNAIKNTYAREVEELTRKTSGFHFNAANATQERLDAFDIGQIASRMETIAPTMWDLLGAVLTADTRSDTQRLSDINMRDEEAGDSEEEYWRDDDADEISATGGDSDDANESESAGIQRREAIYKMSVLGTFFHTCNTPETAIELLSQIGLSISMTTINQVVSSLSAESHNAIRGLGQTLLTSYAYDNFDIELKHYIPTVENPHDTLLHMTSGTTLHLDHNVCTEDLRCSEELWKKSYQAPNDPSGLTRRDRFIKWKFLQDLVTHGPTFFHKFRGDLENPESVDQIPLTKSRQVPLRALDVNQSTKDGNIKALTEFFKQGGVGDPHDLTEGSSESSDIGDHVMACADAIWRIFIQPSQSRDDPTSLMEHVTQIRPKETGKIGSKPGFRRMHQVIQHVGIVSRLDAWQTMVEKSNARWTNLDEFAGSEPDWNQLEDMAAKLAREYVVNENFSSLVFKPPGAQDVQFENALLIQKYFLLYEEITGCGKHKYTSKMIKFLHDLHFLYPEGLSGLPAYRRAIRMNILCNPTGKPHHFRAVDWWVEHNNLYTKRIYGGKSSNHTKTRILNESMLIEVYKKI